MARAVVHRTSRYLTGEIGFQYSWMKEPRIKGILNRVLQILARISPGATTWRVWLNRWRGVKIGEGVWIGYDSIIETSHPHLVTIDDGAAVGLRATIIAHFRELQGVTI